MTCSTCGVAKSQSHSVGEIRRRGHLRLCAPRLSDFATQFVRVKFSPGSFEGPPITLNLRLLPLIEISASSTDPSSTSSARLFCSTAKIPLISSDFLPLVYFQPNDESLPSVIW